jgi:hypothetical protein
MSGSPTYGPTFISRWNHLIAHPCVEAIDGERLPYSVVMMQKCTRFSASRAFVSVAFSTATGRPFCGACMSAPRERYKGRPEDVDRNAALGRTLASKQSWGEIQSVTGCSPATIAKIAKRMKRVAALGCLRLARWWLGFAFSTNPTPPNRPQRRITRWTVGLMHA